MTRRHQDTICQIPLPMSATVSVHSLSFVFLVKTSFFLQDDLYTSKLVPYSVSFFIIIEVVPFLIFFYCCKTAFETNFTIFFITFFNTTPTFTPTIFCGEFFEYLFHCFQPKAHIIPFLI